MKYWVAGSLNYTSAEQAREALTELSASDEVLLTGNAGAEDVAAKIAFEVGSNLRTFAPDNALRATDARPYVYRQIANEADLLVLLYTKENSQIETIREIAINKELLIKEYQQTRYTTE